MGTFSLRYEYTTSLYFAGKLFVKGKIFITFKAVELLSNKSTGFHACFELFVEISCVPNEPMLIDSCLFFCLGVYVVNQYFYIDLVIIWPY